MDRDSAADGTVEETAEREAPASDLPDALWIVPVVLVTMIAGLLTQITRGIHSASLGIALLGTAMVAVIATTLAVVLYFAVFRRNLRRSLAVTAALVFVCFTWIYWTTIGAAIAEPIGVAAVGDVATVLIPVAIVWIAARFGERDRFAIVATGLTFAIVLIMAFVVAPKVGRAPSPPVAVVDGAAHPNTVLLILDGYAREDVLVNDYNPGGLSLADALERRGFVVRDDAVTNYSITYASLSSMVAMDYPFDEGMRTEDEVVEMRALLAGVNPFVGGYREAGYTIVKSENGWAGSACGSWIDECYQTGIVRTSLWAVGQLTPFAPIQRSFFGHPFTSVGLQQIRELPDRLDADGSSPRLILAHMTVPHAPAQLDASCKINPQGVGAGLHLVNPGDSDAMVDEARARYVGQVECVDREVLASIDSLLEQDPDLAILVVADHGPDSRGQLGLNHDEWTDDALIERMSVLSAIRVPEWCDQDGPALTTVNTMRKLAACSLGTEFDALPDRSYWAPRENIDNLPVVEISDRIRSISALSGR